MRHLTEFSPTEWLQLLPLQHAMKQLRNDVNRSHGIAMSWVYHNVVRAIGPCNFGFIDHDLIPIRPVSIDDKLKDRPIYGLINTGRFGFWSLWAGYCFFNYATLKDRRVNFLYDFSRDLDTGGRNWEALYRWIDRKNLHVATSALESRKVAGVEETRKVEFIDRSWLHLSGISYNDTLRDRLAFFEGLEKCFDTAERA